MSYTYVLEQPTPTMGRGFQTICEDCGVLAHYRSREEAQMHMIDHEAGHDHRDETASIMIDIRAGISNMRQAQLRIEEALTA